MFVVCCVVFFLVMLKCLYTVVPHLYPLLYSQPSLIINLPHLYPKIIWSDSPCPIIIYYDCASFISSAVSHLRKSSVPKWGYKRGTMYNPRKKNTLSIFVFIFFLLGIQVTENTDTLLHKIVGFSL